jgi:hypothetical protein
MPIESFQSYLKRKEQEKNNPLNLSPSIDDLDTQIRNAKARIQDAGFNADKETDDRNAFEKFTNLPQGQNAFFDTLELIGRPGNAIRNTIKNTFIEKDQDFLTSLRKGISGKQNVSGSDLLKSAGWEGDTTGTKIGRGIAGFGVDILTDPTNLIPAGLIAKAGSRVISPFAKGARAGYKALENASPGFRKVSEEKLIPFAKRTKDALGKAFVPGYRYGDQLRVDNEGNLLIEETDNQFLKNIQDEADRTRSYLQEESIREVSKAAKATGLDEGTNVGRVMESNLQINKDAEELVLDILKGRNVKLNLTDGDPQDLVQRINTELLNTPEVKQAVRQNEQNVKKIDTELKKIQGVDIDDIEERLKAGKPVSAMEKLQYAEYVAASKSADRLQDQIDRLQKIQDKLENEGRSTKAVERAIFSRQKQLQKSYDRIDKVTGVMYRNALMKTQNNLLDDLTEEESKLFERFNKLQEARQKTSLRLDNIKRGVSFNTLDTTSQAVKNEGFEIVNPAQRLYRKAAGNLRDFLRRISPRGTFEQVFKKELQTKIRPILQSLFTDGQITVNLVKGDPVLDELKRVFGKDIAIRSSDETTSIRLIQNDPNKMYFPLNQAKTDVPESLTNPTKLSDEDIVLKQRIADKDLETRTQAKNQAEEINTELKRIDDEISVLDNEKESFIKELIESLKKEYNDRGGVKIIQDVEYKNSGKGIKASENPVWYQIWYAEKNPKTGGRWYRDPVTGKKKQDKRGTQTYISKAEFERIAREMYDGKYGGVGGSGIPYEEMIDVAEKRIALQEVKDYLVNELDQIKNTGLLDEVTKTVSNPVQNIPGKKYTSADREQVRKIMRQNKNINQEIKDLEKELSVMRQEERVALIQANAAQGIKMSQQQLRDEIDRAVQARSDFTEVTDRLNQLNASKEQAKSMMDVLRMETLNQSKLNMDDLQFTDMLQLIRFERPIRELSQSPMVNLAAKTFTDSNSWLLDYARENGIDIQEIAGYMTHILSQEARKAKEMAKGKPIDSGTFGPLQGNKNVVKRRKYEGSAEDVNELMDKFVFETNAFFSTAIGQKRLIDYIAAESAKRKLLSNPNFAMKYQEGMSVPEGARLISPDQFKFFKVDTPNGNQFLSLKKGEQYVVTEPAFQLLQRYDRAINDEGIRGVLKAVDTVTGTFKRLALFSPGYHIRNVLGAMWNNYIGGMDATDLAKYTSDASNEVTNAVFKEVESDLFREYRQQGLAATSLNKIDMALPGKEPEDIIRETVEDLSKTTGQRVSDRINPLNSQAWKNIFQTSREAGDFFDQINRFALYKWAREKKNYSPEKATELVKAVQFDYTNLTNFEREVMTRIFPFYRWSRNNIPFQLQKFVSDPRKFMRLYYANQEAKEEAKIDEKKQPSYMRNTFNMPFGNRKEGTTFTANLPAEDLSKISGAAAFGKMLVDSINPSLKLPIELVANRNLFTNREISEFEGQRSGLGLPMKADYVLQTLGGMPGRALSGFASKSEAEQINPSSSTAKLLGLPSRPYNQQKNEQIRKIQDLQKLRDLIDRIEQDTGKRPRSINEITSGQGR